MSQKALLVVQTGVSTGRAALLPPLEPHGLADLWLWFFFFYQLIIIIINLHFVFFLKIFPCSYLGGLSLLSLPTRLCSVLPKWRRLWIPLRVLWQPFYKEVHVFSSQRAAALFFLTHTIVYNDRGLSWAVQSRSDPLLPSEIGEMSLKPPETHFPPLAAGKSYTRGGGHGAFLPSEGRTPRRCEGSCALLLWVMPGGREITCQRGRKDRDSLPTTCCFPELHLYLEQK